MVSTLASNYSISDNHTLFTGFSVAFFKPNVAIDAMGRVLVVPQDDFDALANLAQQVSGLPETGAFRNQWR